MSVNRAKNSALMMLTLGQEMETTNNKYNRKVIHAVFYKVRRATDKEARGARGDFRCGLKGSRLNVKSERGCVEQRAPGPPNNWILHILTAFPS